MVDLSMCSLTEFELYVLRHEEERRRREEDMMRHREHLDMRRQPDGFKPSCMESVSTGKMIHFHSDVVFLLAGLQTMTKMVTTMFPFFLYFFIYY